MRTWDLAVDVDAAADTPVFLQIADGISRAVVAGARHGRRRGLEGGAGAQEDPSYAGATCPAGLRLSTADAGASAPPHGLAEGDARHAVGRPRHEIGRASCRE